MLKQDILDMLSHIKHNNKVVLYDGDDKIFKLSFYELPTPGELWLKVEFDTTVEDLDVQ
jgi:hypothetical protein